MKILIIQFLQPPITSSLLVPNILLTTLFSNVVHLCSSLNVKAKSHTHEIVIHEQVLVSLQD
jgi:hypothetical protein